MSARLIAQVAAAHGLDLHDLKVALPREYRKRWYPPVSRRDGTTGKPGYVQEVVFLCPICEISMVCNPGEICAECREPEAA